MDFTGSLYIKQKNDVIKAERRLLKVSLFYLLLTYIDDLGANFFLSRFSKVRSSKELASKIVGVFRH